MTHRLLTVALLSVSCIAMAATAAPIKLTPKQLYSGFEATKVVLSEDAAKISLDARVFKYGRHKKGVLTTDPVDLGPVEDVIGLPAQVKSVDVEVLGEAPDGSAITVELRSGANKVDLSAWSPWKKLEGLKASVKPLSGRYVQVRITLTSANANALPAISSVALVPDLQADPVADWTPLKATDAKIQHIVRSPITFHYERPDHPRLVKFRKEAKLDEVVAGAKDDLEKLIKLMDWTGSCNNVRGTKRERGKRGYAWNLDNVFSMDGGKPNIYGHCMSYCEVLVSAATALGYVGARHYSIKGFREATHEVPDIWCPSLGKWIYLDPSLSNFYRDKKTKEVLNILEIHDIVADTFVPEGKDMHWWSKRRAQDTRARVKKIGGKTPIDGRLGPWKYGTPMPKDYNWGWSHGYLACGFIQMTPRNDFHSHPEKNPRKFGSYPGYAGYPFWSDKKTPPTRGGHNWYTRKRDFYWTLDQASLQLVRVKEDTVTVELGQSMPFFKKYQLKIDGKDVSDVTNPFTWKLKKGVNKLHVAPVDEFGKVGLASSVTLTLGK